MSDEELVERLAALEREPRRDRWSEQTAARLRSLYEAATPSQRQFMRETVQLGRWRSPDKRTLADGAIRDIPAQQHIRVGLLFESIGWPPRSARQPHLCHLRLPQRDGCRDGCRALVPRGGRDLVGADGTGSQGLPCSPSDSWLHGLPRQSHATRRPALDARGQRNPTADGRTHNEYRAGPTRIGRPLVRGDRSGALRRTSRPGCSVPGSGHS